SDGFEQTVDFLNARPIRKPKRKDTQVPQPSGPTESVADEDVHRESGDSLVRAATTASSLEAEQNSGNTLQSDEDSLKLDELMELCTNLQNGVLNLEKTKTTQKNEIDSLKRRGRRIDTIDADDEITLVNGVENEMFDVDNLGGEEVFVAEQEVAKIYADHQLAKRMQAQEQKDLSDAEKDTLFQQLLEKRRKALKRVNIFEDIRIELVKEKRAGEELIQDSIKKQKVEDDKEKAELKQLVETIPDEEEVAIDAIPLAVKSPRIVDWKIHKEAKKATIK
nr:hypothetical protein [Tanacetum cinerariifolium]